MNSPGSAGTVGHSLLPQAWWGSREARCTAWSDRWQPLRRGRTQRGTIHAPSKLENAQVRGQIVDLPLVFTGVA